MLEFFYILEADGMRTPKFSCFCITLMECLILFQKTILSKPEFLWLFCGLLCLPTTLIMTLMGATSDTGDICHMGIGGNRFHSYGKVRHVEWLSIFFYREKNNTYVTVRTVRTVFMIFQRLPRGDFSLSEKGWVFSGHPKSANSARS